MDQLPAESVLCVECGADVSTKDFAAHVEGHPDFLAWAERYAASLRRRRERLGSLLATLILADLRRFPSLRPPAIP
jgi:hypothetical protein